MVCPVAPGKGGRGGSRRTAPHVLYGGGRLVVAANQRCGLLKVAARANDCCGDHVHHSSQVHPCRLADRGGGPRGLQRQPEPRRRAAGARGDRGQSVQAHHRGPGRICRPLRGGRFGRGARPPERLSQRHPLSGRPDGEAGRSPLHHRSAPVPDRARPGARQSRAGAGQPGLRRSRSRPRAGAPAQQDHHRADLRAAHPGQAGGGRLRHRPGGPGPFRRARSQRIHRAARPGGGADRRPAGVTRQPGDRRDQRQHHALGHHRIDRSDPVRVHLRRGLVSALPAARQGRQGYGQPRRLGAGEDQADRRAGFRPRRPHGFRRQRDRPRHRHHPGPRPVRQSGRPVHPRHVRQHQGAGIDALRGPAGARCGDRLRAGAQIRIGGRCARMSCARNT